MTNVYIFASLLGAVAFNSVQGNHANHGKYYVFANRKGCAEVRSQALCPASKLNPAYAMNYDSHIRWTQSIMDSAEASNVNNSECITALKTALCSIFAAKCFEDGSKDFGNGNAACWKANATCDDVVLYDFQFTCRSIPPEGKHSLDECILPSGPIDGSCPEPEYKMPADLLPDYKRTSGFFEKFRHFQQIETARYPSNSKNQSLNGTLVFSRQCASDLKEIECVPVYCSADEERLLTKHNWKECKRIVNTCFDMAVDNLPDVMKNIFLKKKKQHMYRCNYYGNSTEMEFPSGTAACNYQSFLQHLLILVFAVFTNMIV